MVMYQPVGGMDRIPYAFEAALRRRPTYGAEVTEIRNTTSGVEVTYRRGGRTRTTTADICVSAIPPHLLRRITNNLGPDIDAHLARSLIFGAGKMGLQYGRRWWEEDEQIFGGITHTNLDITEIWYPSYDYLGAKGVLHGYYVGGDASATYAALSPAAREARALERGARIHGPVYVDEFETSFSHHWERDRYSEGAFVFWSPEAFEVPDGPFGPLLEPAGNVYFAGDLLTLNP